MEEIETEIVEVIEDRREEIVIWKKVSYHPFLRFPCVALPVTCE